MMWAERRGILGQGLLKLVGTEGLLSIQPTGEMETAVKSTVSALITGRNQPSFFVAKEATNEAISRATREGCAFIGINGIRSSIGPLGYYAEQMAEGGLVSFVAARSPAAVAPFGLKTRLFGTNPFAVSFPTSEEPFVFDMATSALTWYELVLAANRGEAVSAGVAINRHGEPTTDPIEAMSGALLPFGDKSFRSATLGMLVELFAGPLVGATYCDANGGGDWGAFICAFRPDLLGDADTIRREASRLLNIVRSCAADEKREVRLPGDRAKKNEASVNRTKTIVVERVVAELLGLTAVVGG
jgi:LDH2 family malate/lactate/ureidoglycolate dehydrogenase